MALLLTYFSLLLLSAAWHTLAAGIAEIIAQTPELAALNSVLTTEHPEYLAALNATKGTFFAPSNEAMAAFMASVDPSTFNPEIVKDLLAYHSLPRVLSESDLSAAGGVLAETSLTNAEYVNLDAGKGNVIFASAYGSAGLDSSASTLKVYSGVGEAAAVVKAGIEYDDGLIHVVDHVLNLPQSGTKTLEAASLKIALEIIQKTGVTDTDGNTAKVTSFVPTDDAFKAAGVDISALSEEELIAALRYHTIVGEVGYSTVLEDGKEYATLLGPPVVVHKKDGQLLVNDVPVQQANVILKNGVLHVLGGVFAPPGLGDHQE